MKGEISVKRIICALLILFMLPACAFALDLDDFNMCAYIFGEPEIDPSSGKTVKNYVMFESDGCTVSFKEENGTIMNISVNGDGVPFLAYSMAAIMVFDPDSANLTSNAGQLLSMFLMNRKESEETYGTIAAGGFFAIGKNENGYIFIVGK